MNKQQYRRLLPFLHRKSARQRVILFLLADGFAVSELMAMSVARLRAIRLPVAIEVCRDEMLHGLKRGYAFLYPGGAQLPHIAYSRLLQDTAEKVLGRPMSQDSFRVYIQKG